MCANSMLTADQPRAAWIIPSTRAGGIGPVALEVTSALAAVGVCDVTLVETHAAPHREGVEDGALRRVALDLTGAGADPSVVLNWLGDNPQDVIFSNDVSHLEGIFPYIPSDTLHVAVLHDVARRYRDHVVSCARYLDSVVAVSDYVCDWARKDLRAIGFSGVVRRIHNGAKYPPPLDRAAATGPLRLLFIGNAWLKGGSQLGPIVKALRRRGVDFRLTVVGEEPPQLRRQMARAGLGERLTSIRRQSREELWRTYASHDILLMLSWGEPFGMVTIEAMGMGCVPVACDVPSGSREIIENGISGILVHPSPHEIAAVLEKISARRLFRMSSEASRRARVHFTAERAAQQYAQLIDDLMHCKALICRSRLSLTRVPSVIELPRRSSLARLYGALPSSLRRRIRHGFANYPTGARWLRERF
jgi:glycosyltransferase involved in cell wall biosynthesis